LLADLKRDGVNAASVRSFLGKASGHEEEFGDIRSRAFFFGVAAGSVSSEDGIRREHDSEVAWLDSVNPNTGSRRSYLDDAVVHNFHDNLVNHPLYQKAQATANPTERAKLLHQARVDVQLKTPGARDLNIGDINPNARVLQPGTARASAAAEVAAAHATNLEAFNSVFTSAENTNAANAARIVANVNKITSDMSHKAVTSWAEESMAKTSQIGQVTPKKRLGPGGPATIERAVGFGEQESAMATINKSLQSTQRSLSAIETKLAGMGKTPPVTASTK
jgi:hypothetical protein